LRETPQGLLFFPMTPFNSDQSINLKALEQHLILGLESNPGGIFLGCGAGEFHALSENEIYEITDLANSIDRGDIPLYIGVGGPIQSAKNIASYAEAHGVDGLLVFPPYMVTSSEEGLIRYFQELTADMQIPIIAYNRPGSILTMKVIEKLLEIENLVGIKDGMGNMSAVAEIVYFITAWEKLNQRTRKISFMNGNPTAEITALSFREIGITTYSSAVLSFAPEISKLFYDSLVDQRDDVTNVLLNDFYLPLAQIRDEIEGGAVSLMKAGARIKGFNYGGVRAPLMDFSGDQTIRLTSLIKRGMEIVQSTSKN
jgi:5-dehydro-4-deoxyglucarate dehydratase